MTHDFALPDASSVIDHLGIVGLLFMIIGFSTFCFTLLLHATEVRYGENNRCPKLTSLGTRHSGRAGSRSSIAPGSGCPATRSGGRSAASRARMSATSAAVSRRPTCARSSTKVKSATLVDIALAEDLKSLPHVTAIEGTLPGVLDALPDQSLDVVLCMSVVEHLWEPADDPHAFPASPAARRRLCHQRAVLAGQAGTGVLGVPPGPVTGLRDGRPQDLLRPS